MDKQEPTSIKELFQGMIPDSTGVIRGVVVSEAPLKIKAVNDDKLIMEENIICLPRHLSDYTTKIDIQLGDGSIDSQTYSDGAHSHPNASFGGAHVNQLQTFNIFGATVKVYNALKTGDKVFILSFNEGKKYYILDREVE